MLFDFVDKESQLSQNIKLYYQFHSDRFKGRGSQLNFGLFSFRLTSWPLINA